METECFPAVSMSSATGQQDFPEDILIKQEPPSPPPASPPRAHSMSTISSLLNAPSPPLSTSSIASLHPQSLLKQPTIVLAARTPAMHAAASTSARDHQVLYPKVNIKVEPQLSSKCEMHFYWHKNCKVRRGNVANSAFSELNVTHFSLI